MLIFWCDKHHICLYCPEKIFRQRVNSQNILETYLLTINIPCLIKIERYCCTSEILKIISGQITEHKQWAMKSSLQQWGDFCKQEQFYYFDSFYYCYLTSNKKVLYVLPCWYKSIFCIASACFFSPIRMVHDPFLLGFFCSA